MVKNKRVRRNLFYIILIIVGLIIFFRLKYIFLKNNKQVLVKPNYIYKAEELLKNAQNENIDIVFNKDPGILQDKEKDIEIKLNFEISLGDTIPGSPEDFFQITSFTSDNIGNMYVSEMYDSQIKKFDKHGNFINKFGKKGAGPGEFLMLQQVAYDSQGNLWAVDIGTKRISIFSKEGIYLDSFQCDLLSSIADFVIDNNNSFYLSTWDPISDKVIHKFNQSGKLLLSFGKSVKFPEPLTRADHIVKKTISPGKLAIYKNYLYFSRFNPYEIRKYSLDGDLKMIIIRENNFMTPSIPEIKGDMISYKMPTMSSFLCINQDIILNYIFTQEHERIIDFFNLNGNLLTTYRPKKRLSLASSDKRNNLYGLLTEGDITKLVRFKITFKNM